MALRREIVHGLPEGTQLPLAELSRRFNVSTMPIRSALVRLQSEGLVFQEPRKGAVVAPLSVDDFLDLDAVRMALESAAAFYAAPQLNDNDVVTMRALLHEMETLHLEDLDVVDQYLGMDWKLHDVCYHAVRRPRLSHLIEVHRRQAERYIRVYMERKSELPADIKLQRRFVEACESRDSTMAATAVRSLFEWTKEALLGGLLSN